MTWQTAVMIYFICCAAIFLFAITTAVGDTQIMRKTGEPEYPWPEVKALLLILITAFLPIVNIVMFVNTILYRRGML